MAKSKNILGRLGICTLWSDVPERCQYKAIVYLRSLFYTIHFLTTIALPSLLILLVVGLAMSCDCETRLCMGALEYQKPTCNHSSTRIKYPTVCLCPKESIVTIKRVLKWKPRGTASFCSQPLKQVSIPPSPGRETDQFRTCLLL